MISASELLEHLGDGQVQVEFYENIIGHLIGQL
jgi:hypothetical protein